MGGYGRCIRRGEPQPPCGHNCPDRGGPDCHTDRCEYGWGEYQEELREFKRQKKLNSEYTRYRRSSIENEKDLQAKTKKHTAQYRELHSKK